MSRISKIMRPAYPTIIRWLLPLLILLSPAALASEAARSDRFTLAVIPDTQNSVDFRHQAAAGFEFDAADLFIEQMRFVARNAVANGGDIAFVTAVGDVWQHQTVDIDPEHYRRGMRIEPDPILARRAVQRDGVLGFELPKATEGYRIISEAGLPFGVVPGNHDYDAKWSVAGYPPNRDKQWKDMTWTVADMGILHVGGLDNFRSVFGAQSDFFRDRDWYVDHFRGGASSAQRFSAAGYEFLHIGIEMQAGDEVLDWVESVLAKYPGLPTILTTHDYLNPRAERKPRELDDYARVEPEFHNTAEQVWQKLISRHDQIFLVLCGHHPGQSMRVDANQHGNPVYQVLANYQGRGQSAFDHGREKRRGIGDGWLRLMRFDFSTTPASIRVATYSPYYGRYSSQVAEYADWYKQREQPDMSDAEFQAADEFVISLDGFSQRFRRN